MSMDTQYSVVTQIAWRDSLGRYISAVEDAGNQAVLTGSERGAFIAAILAPKETGTLAASIQPIITGSGQGGFVARAPYSLVQEKGGAPHTIAPRGNYPLENAKKAFFSWKAVQHPGNPATSFMSRAAAVIQQELPSLIRNALG